MKHDGNLTIEDVYEVARVMRDRSCAASFAGTVKEMLGSCVSGGLRLLANNENTGCMHGGGRFRVGVCVLLAASCGG